MAIGDDLTKAPFYHGTRAELRAGDLIERGHPSNFGTRKKAGHVYLTRTLGAAAWGAELAQGDGSGRIYTVEPTGPIEDDPNLTNTKYPGNPTQSYRSREPLRVTGEVLDWPGHTSAEIQTMKERIKNIVPNERS